MTLATMTFSEVTRLPGVADIQPVKAKGAFAKALLFEAKGDRDMAAHWLDEAVAVAVG